MISNGICLSLSDLLHLIWQSLGPSMLLQVALLLLLLSRFSRVRLWSHRQQPTRPPHPWDSPDKNSGVGCHFLLPCMKVKSESQVAQCVRLFTTPWTAAYQAPPSMGFSRRVLEWGAIAFSSKWHYFLLILWLSSSPSSTCTKSF